MNDIIKKTMDSVSPYWGTCRFDGQSLIQCRAISRIPKDAKSIVVALFPYYLGEDAYDGQNVSKYAVVPDYHKTIGQKLDKAVCELRVKFPNEAFEHFTDNSPLPEVLTAIRAGLGVRGKNGLLINKEFGSWVFIGEIITTLELEHSNEKAAQCLNCGQCIKMCPTGALSKNGFDKDKCLSGITQQKGDLTEEQVELIEQSGCAWGCDICQSVCPLNSNAKVTPIQEFSLNAKASVDLCDDIEGRAFEWRGKKVIQRNLKILEK
ncbi:MAG TPA: QueG-associated DUF1730 domain-containing protein [Clostridia bacterium]|nr:QueG-associated DUF1730 domain-containing protein [Clostridia bacterium]